MRGVEYVKFYYFTSMYCIWKLFGKNTKKVYIILEEYLNLQTAVRRIIIIVNVVHIRTIVKIKVHTKNKN